jgi:uncharacterized protein YbjT (DUF2867 family)
MYAITGATGHIGSRIAGLLLEKGKPVRVIGRNFERLSGLVGKGAEACVGTLEDAKFLSEAFAGAEAVFAMIPPNMQTDDFPAFQKRVSESIVEAVRAAKITHVVNLSSLGAELPRGTGPIAGLYDHEKRMARVKGPSIVNLRAAFFMENLLPNLDMIRNQGINGSPLKPDMRIPMIATRDIVDAAVKYLPIRGMPAITVRELLGQRNLSMNEATQILGKAIGKPDLKYVQFPYESAREAMIKMGLSASITDLFIEMYRAINDGRLMRNLVRTPENTTATSFETFVREVALAGSPQPGDTASSGGMNGRAIAA